MAGAPRFPLLLLVVVGTLFHGGFTHQQHYQTRREIIVDEDVNRCTALVRRTSIERQLVSYPCFRPLPGITPVVAHQSPAGLVCKGYTNIPVTNYYRVKMCCPGWSPDRQGRCIIRGNRQLIVQKSVLPKKSLKQLTKYPASYEDRRTRVLKYLKPLFAQLLNRQSSPWEDMVQQHSSWDDMVQHRLSWDDMIQQRPWDDMVRQRMQEIIRQRAIMRQKYLRSMQEQMHKQIQMAVARIIPFSLSASLMTRTPFMTKHIYVLRRPQQTSRAPVQTFLRNIQRLQFRPQPTVPQIPAKPFPQIPNVEQKVRLPDHPGQVNHVHPQMMMQGPRMQRPVMLHRHGRPNGIPQIPRRPFPGVQLPQLPVQMPPVNVQPGPNSPFGAPPCFSNYVETVKRCYRESDATAPQDQNSFNEIAYELRMVCEKRNIIIDCIHQNLGRCNHPQEQMMIRGSLESTITELHSMCEMENIDPINQDTADGMTNTDVISKTEEEPIEERFTGNTNVKEPKQETIKKETAPVKQVPVPVKAETKIEKPKIKQSVNAVTSDKHVKTKPVAEEHKKKEDKINEEVLNKKNDLSAQRAHDIKVEELENEVHHHYLPLLIGTAVAIGAIVILLLTLVCLCCRRRMKKKVYIEKEPEKPKLLDGIYTIGVPPPVYEVNGIPPLSYEEAKGLKITGTPTSARRNIDNEINDQQETASMTGTVSDI